MRYFAFQLYDSQEGAELQVDTDPAALWTRLQNVLNEVRGSGAGIETFEVGQVEASNPDAALNEVRSDRWLEGTHGYADGEGYEDEEDYDEDEDYEDYDDEDSTFLGDDHIGKVTLTWHDEALYAVWPADDGSPDSYLGEWDGDEWVPSALLLRSMAGFQQWVDKFARS